MGTSAVLLRPADVARELDVTTGRVYQKIAAGELPAIKYGRAVRIPAEAWELWKKQQAEQALANMK